MNQHIQKQIEREIRKAYSGLLPEEQIEATITWWNKLASTVWEEAEKAGYAEAMRESIEIVNEVQKLHTEAIKQTT